MNVLPFTYMMSACALMTAPMARPASAQPILVDAEVAISGNRLPDADAMYPFVAKDISLEETLRLFSRNLRIGLSIEEDFDGSQIVNVDLKATSEQYLEELASMFDFRWYFDGVVLHISAVGTFETQVFALQQTNGDELISLLVSLGVYQPRFRHRADDRRRALLVSGPRAYLDVVAKVVEAAETSEQRKVVIMRGGSSQRNSVVTFEADQPVEDTPPSSTATE